MSTKPHYAGHRRRLRQRFFAAGADSLRDYELLELVLFLAQPRKDTKPLAKALLARFGSFAEVIGADPRELAALDDVGDTTIAALKTVQAAAQRLLRDRVMRQPVLANWQSVLDYCRASMADEATERFRILYLNAKNVLIADEVQQRGTVDHTPVYPREVVKRALELAASALIMVHNHPSGDPTPSKSDVLITREVREAAEKLGISLHDHLIVGKGGVKSFKALGLL